MAYRDIIMASAPAAYYRLGDGVADLIDASGNGLHGSYTAPLTKVSSLLAYGEDAASTGPWNIGTRPSTPWIGGASDPWTVEALIRVDTWAPSRQIVGTETDPLNGWQWRLGSTTGQLQVYTPALAAHTITSGVQVGKVHHAVIRSSGSRFEGFLDGVKSGEKSGSPSAASGQLLIGNHRASALSFPGALDEIACYGRALTDTEIADHAKAALGAVAPADPKGGAVGWGLIPI